MSAPRTPHTVILASAGTGKTHRLTSRFLALVAHGQAPERILATTFTRKAAGEILGRVLQRLSAAAESEEGLARLNEALAGEGPPARLTRESARACLVAVARAMHRLSVQTIDSFFFRAASAFALDLGAPPGWRMLENAGAEDVRRRGAGRALAAGAPGELAALFTLFYAGGAGRSAHATLLRLGEDAQRAWLATRGAPEVWDVVGDTPPALGDAAVRAAIERVRNVALPVTKSTGAPDGNWVKAHNTGVAHADARQWEAFLGKGLAAALLGDGDYRKKPVSEEIAAAYAPLIEHARGVLLRDYAGTNSATRDLVSRLCEACDALKHEVSGFEFDDIPRLLLGAGAGGRLEDLYYRLDGRIDHVLLDEFQDTSVVQFRLLEPMLRELCAQDEGGRSVFVVGDVKQSLYGWREAEPALLRGMPEAFPTLAAETLSTSRRSSQIVLDAVNSVFAGLSSNAALRDCEAALEGWGDFAAHEEWVDPRKGRKPGVVRLFVGPQAMAADGSPVRADSVAQKHATLAFGAGRVAALLREAPGARVGVLVRANKAIPPLIEALRSRGIAASEEGGNPLTDSAPVAVCLSLLRLVEHPGDAAALFHVATTPLGAAAGLGGPLDAPASRPALEALRSRIDREGLAPTLPDLLARTARSMNARDLRRFEQLIELAQDFDARPWRRLDEFDRLVRATGVEEPGRERVRVMTIHAAKGLEFDAVVLPDLGRPWTLGAKEVIVDRPGPLDAPTAACGRPSKLLQSLDAGLAEIAARATARKISEELCGLYVAMTRAAFALEMIAPPMKAVEDGDDDDAKAPSAARVLVAALAPGAPLTPGALAFERGGEGWGRAIAARPGAQGRDAERTSAPMRLKSPQGTPALRHARTRTPSDLRDSPLVDLGATLRSAGGAARREGELLHAMFELVGWIEDGEPAEEALLAAAAAVGASTAHALEAIAKFRAACARPGVREALSRESAARRAPAGAALSLRREWDFIVRDSGATPGATGVSLLRGRFDRVAIASVGGKAAWAEVVDFKTGGATPAGELEAYGPQMRAYRRAAGALLGLGAGRVGARIVLTDAGSVVDVGA